MPRLRALLPCSLLVCLLLPTRCHPSPPIKHGSQPASPRDAPVTIQIDIAKPLNTFSPTEVLGAGVDGREQGSVAQTYTLATMKAMLSAGFKPLTYRLRTELGVESWHWNPKGRWSEAKKKCGYWTSEARPGAPIRLSNGYKLPRRGNTIDQANNRGYSRLTDGDPVSFWKSNPYLDKHFTGEDNTAHVQWVMIALENPLPVNAVRLLWGNPFAVDYCIEYYTGENPVSLDEHPDKNQGTWLPFPMGRVEAGRGEMETVRFAETPLPIRYLRIAMKTSSGKARPASSDIRDNVGYALREIWLGTLKAGVFHDLLKHGKSAATQTTIYTSSTDPWHTEADKDVNVEQPGFDLVFRGPLPNHLPVLIPVAPLYDTPENAAAEIRYLRARGYPIRGIEMGEEPDGQLISPEDYAALYIQFADALHAVDPKLKLGGPGFQTSVVDYVTWPDAGGNVSWMNRFLLALRRRGHQNDFNFFSFEWYPFDNVCAPTPPQLAAAPEMLSALMAKLKQSGVSPEIPWLITEYGYSSFAGQAEVEMAGALLNAEIPAQFLSLGGKTAYLYGYEPEELMREQSDCDTWGNLALFLADKRGYITQPLATYYAARMLTQKWLQPGSGLHTLFPAVSGLRNSQGQPLITAYTVYRPDRQWSLLLLNKDPKQQHPVQIRFCTEGASGTEWNGSLAMTQYSGKQYQWHPHGIKGYASPNLPPEHRRLQAASHPSLVLPPYSITVLTGDGPTPLRLR